MENLRALVYGRKLNNYQKALAKAEFEKLEKPDNRQLNTDDVNGSLHIEFAMYLCGYSREDIEQMFNDWQQFQ